MFSVKCQDVLVGKMKVSFGKTWVRITCEKETVAIYFQENGEPIKIDIKYVEKTTDIFTDSGKPDVFGDILRDNTRDRELHELHDVSG